jgi:putative ABC transport system ATP-binding protein
MADLSVAASVRLEDVQKTYRTGEVDVHAVRGISMEIGRGEFVALMGSSGSGKSTLMNILGCLDRPTAGHYFLDGEDVSSLSRDQLADVRNRKLGFVFQNFNLLARTSALENVELPLLYGPARLSNAQLRDKAERVLEAVGLINDPEVLLADEPTGNLDSRTSVEVMGIFQGLNDKGITIIMVTHEPDIASYARRNVVMRDGRIVSDRAVTRRLDATLELEKLNELPPELMVPVAET